MSTRSCTKVVFVLCLGLVPSGRVAAQSVSAPQETLRIERLETLADIWGKLWLFHPNIATSELDWESILIRTIPEVERAQTLDELVNVLNRSLFAPLGDPTLAAQKNVPFDEGERSPLSVRKLSGRVGYIDATDPREQKTKDFAQRFLSLVSELGDIETLVVDLRYRFSPAELEGERIYNLVNTRWLGLFTDRALPVGLYARRKHHGWSSGGSSRSIYYESWEVGGSWNDRGYSGMPLKPVDGVASLNRPTLILINNASYPILESALDALQTSGHVAVAWERTGPFVDWQRFQGRTILEYNGFRVWFMNAALISREGGLRLQPDFATESPIGEEQIVAFARRVRDSGPGPRPPFSPQVMASSVTTRWLSLRNLPALPLSREQRLLGLFKIWTVIGYFFPHLEFADLEWATELRDWIPRVEEASTDEYHHEVLMELAGKLNDNHVGYTAPGRADRLGVHFPPLWLGRVEGKVVITWLHSLAENADVAIGDEVLAIDGEPIEAVERKRRSRSSFSTEQGFNKDWFRALRGHEGTEVALTLRRNDRHWTVRLNHNLSRNGFAALGWADRGSDRRFPGGVGYINIGGFESGEALEETFESYRNSSGLVFDLRWPYSGPNQGFRGWFVDHLADQRVKRASDQVPVVASHDRSVIQFVRLPQFHPPSLYNVDPPVRMVGASRPRAVHQTGRRTYR